ncbi:MAG: Smr/MutS family protein [Pseudomonadota bacterium]|nr:Smr/MutS family protein [Pseudomonadota bacterium]
MKKKPKNISVEDQNLWENFLERSEVVESVRKTKIHIVQSPHPRSTKKKALDKVSTTFKKHVSEKGSTRYERHSLDKKLLSKLRNGHVNPERKLDLHGFTYDDALRKVNQTIQNSFKDGIRLVLIITGKGRKIDPYESFFEDKPKGLLRESLPLWLQSPQLDRLILSVVGAHGCHGGSGAYYVYLRKNKLITRHNVERQ